MPEVKCKHCGEKRPALSFAPLPNELGQKIAAEICQPCWSAWLQKQTQIINHYGLDLTNPDSPARQLALADNRVGQLNLEWDVERLKELRADGLAAERVGGPELALVAVLEVGAERLVVALAQLERRAGGWRGLGHRMRRLPAAAPRGGGSGVQVTAVASP